MASQAPDTQGPGGDGGGAPASPLIHRTDLWVTVIILAFCGAAYYVTTTFDAVPELLAQNIPPEWFPRLLIWTIVVLTLALPFEHRFLERRGEGLDEDRGDRIRPIAVSTAVLLCLVVASISVIGTVYAMVLVCIALPVMWGERRWKMLVPYVLLFPAIVALIFTQLLKVFFEPGLFGLDLS